MAMYTRVRDEASGWEYTCSAQAIPEGVEVLEHTDHAGPPTRIQKTDPKLTGADLEAALKERGLPSTGSADDKRAAVAQYDAENPEA